MPEAAAHAGIDHIPQPLRARIAWNLPLGTVGLVEKTFFSDRLGPPRLHHPPLAVTRASARIYFFRAR